MASTYMPGQGVGDEPVDEAPRDLRPRECAVQNRPEQRVEGGVNVEVGRELAGGDAAFEHLPFPLALRVKVALVEYRGHRRVVLGFADQGEQDLAGWLDGEEAREGPQVPARALDRRALLGKRELAAGIVDQGVEQDVDLRWPPAVDRLLGHAGPGRDPFDRDAAETALDQQVVRGVEHGEAGVLVTAMRGAPLRDARRGGRGIWHTRGA